MNQVLLKKQLMSFLNEDIGSGDLSCQALFEDQQIFGKGQFISKQDGLFVGEQVIQETYSLFNENIDSHLFKKDGEIIRKGDVIAEITGSYDVLLKAERVLLNIIQRLSGIATITNKTIQKLANEQIKITDTRKTTPGLRMLEKYAVRCGGGVNHRFGLYDAIMLKDNHIAAMGSISEAIYKARQKSGHMVKVEVEIGNEIQLKEAIESAVDVIMFDNMAPTEIKEMIDLVPKHIVTEASGNITLENIADFRDSGVNMISLGFLTHSATALDISFNIMEEMK